MGLPNTCGRRTHPGIVSKLGFGSDQKAIGAQFALSSLFLPFLLCYTHFLRDHAAYLNARVRIPTLDQRCFVIHFDSPYITAFKRKLSGSSPCCSRPLANEFLRIREIMFCTTHSTYTSETFCACWFHKLSSMCYFNTLAYTALPRASEILLSFHRERSFSFFWNTRAATTLRTEFSSPPGQ